MPDMELVKNMLCKMKNTNACVLKWKSKKMRSKVVSSLAGETMAMINMIGADLWRQVARYSQGGGNCCKEPGQGGAVGRADECLLAGARHRCDQAGDTHQEGGD